MPHRSAFRSLAAPFALVLLCLLVSTGCRRASPFLLGAEGSASINLVPVNPEWPRRFEDLTPVQQEVWRERGRPHLAHIEWSTYREVVDPMTAQIDLRNTGMRIEDKKFSWVYVKDDDGTEILFRTPGRVETRPLSDQLKAIMRYGDPQQMASPSGAPGRRLETWTYLNYGVRLTFENGKLIMQDTGSVPAMPAYRGQ